MRRVFGASKKKDPPPTIQDATDRVLLLRIPFFYYCFCRMKEIVFRILLMFYAVVL